MNEHQAEPEPTKEEIEALTAEINQTFESAALGCLEALGKERFRKFAEWIDQDAFGFDEAVQKIAQAFFPEDFVQEGEGNAED